MMCDRFYKQCTCGEKVHVNFHCSTCGGNPWNIPQPSVYIASKTVHAPKWLELRSQGLNIISTWIDEYLPGASVDKVDLAIRCVKESTSADYLILYCGHEDEILKDANVEYGCALGNGKKILIVGTCKTVGNTLHFHPNVRRLPTIESALRLIKLDAKV